MSARVVAMVLVVLLAFVTHRAAAQTGADTTMAVRFGAFVDGYYAWDVNRPRTLDRAFLTQPARHNEFNINLAYADAVVTGARVRGRVALQYGTSVMANYAGEPRIGVTSGSEVSRNIQEAVIGVRLAPALWIDGGIFLSHLGSESWISRDNLTYTRSLTAEFSPYYQSGVKLSWQATPRLSAQLNVVNGWQVVSESNSAKSAGVRVEYAATRAVRLALYNLIGREGDDSLPRDLRIFHGVSATVTPTERFTVAANVDVGLETVGGDRSSWHGMTLIARMQPAPTLAVVGRLERYIDPHQVIVSTGTTDGFRANGVSLGIDLVPAPRTLWRTEVRALFSPDRIFPARDASRTSNTVLVTSLALTL